MPLILDEDFSLEPIKERIVGLNIEPAIATQDILEFLQSKYGSDEKFVKLQHDQNPCISKKMNYFIENWVWVMQ